MYKYTNKYTHIRNKHVYIYLWVFPPSRVRMWPCDVLFNRQDVVHIQTPIILTLYIYVDIYIYIYTYIHVYTHKFIPPALLHTGMLFFHPDCCV